MKKLRRFLQKRWYLIVFILLIVGGWYSTIQPKRARGELYTVQRHDLTETLTLSGQIEAEEKTILRFQTSGRLAWLGVKIGDKVWAYQTIASLDQRDVQKNLEKKLNSYLKTRWDFEQTQDDYEGKIMTDAIKRILEKSQFDLNNSVLDVEIQHLAVEFANLISPISGVVTKVNPPIAGVNITPTQAEFEIVNPRTVYLSVLADQTEVGRVKEGISTRITFDSFPSDKVSGTVKTISFAPKEGEAGTVYEVKVFFPLPGEGWRYRLGMTADATFSVREKANTLAVPGSFITKDGDKRFVTKVVGRRKIKTPIVAADEWDNLTEIQSGLSEGDLLASP